MKRTENALSRWLDMHRTAPTTPETVWRRTPPRVLVVGDVMLDRYTRGMIERISPEAPIPIVAAQTREDRLGGAGGVAAMLRALGAAVHLVSLVGDDDEAHGVRRLLQGIGISTDDLLVDAARCTTLKHRVVASAPSSRPAQMLRLDRETTSPASDAIVDQAVCRAHALLPEVDAVVISDYAKGLCRKSLLEAILRAAKQRGVPSIVDPCCGADYTHYQDATCVTPNRSEASAAAGMAIESPADGLDAARRLLHCGAAHALVKLDEDGLAWAAADGRFGSFGCRRRAVCDVTGAGDMVAAILGYFLPSGMEFPQICELANAAAGRQVEQLGAAPISLDELESEITRAEGCRSATRKLLPLAELTSTLARRRAAGERIVLTNGCFDLFHPGHLAALQFARAQGDCLVVAVNSDTSVRRLKGAARPIVDEAGRAAIVAGLECVHHVVVFDAPSVAEVVAAISPDVLVKSAAYAPGEVVGGDVVRRRGGRVALAPHLDGYSSTAILRRMRQVNTFAGAVPSGGATPSERGMRMQNGQLAPACGAAAEH